MKKINLPKTIQNAQLAISKHSPEILTGLGIAGMITTTVMAVKATPKALFLIEDEKHRIKLENDDYEVEPELKAKEVVKITWKCYIPSAVTGIVSIACLVGASSVNVRRNAALATAYTLSESTLKEYQKKVVETIGEKKEQTVRDAIAKDKLEKNPPSNNEVFITEKGNTLCYDVISGRYFRSDIEKIRKAENQLNHQLMQEMYLSLNDFYYELGLRPTKQGNEMGWNINDGLIDLHFSTQLSDDDEPCLVIDYHVAPRYGYGDLS